MRAPAGLTGALVVAALATTAACGPAVGANERLLVDGRLEREGISGGDDAEVVVEYLSDGSRGEWWPCDLRVTAQGCVDDRHVNVYIALPQVTTLDGLGGAACVNDGVPQGLYELIDDNTSDELSVGSEVSVFVLVASNADDVPGAELGNDDETLAAARLTSGTLSIYEKGDVEEPLRFHIDGETAGGRAVTIEFNGPMSAPSTIPPLEGPSTCVNRMLVEQ